MRQWSFVFFDLTMWNSPPSGSFWCDFVLTTVPCHLLFTTVNSSYRAWAAAKIIFFRIVMKLPSTDVTFLLCSKLSVYFLTYLLSRPAAMHCSTHKATMFYTLSFDDANLSSDAVLQLGYFRKEHESVANASRLSVATAQLSVNTELIYIRWWSQLRL